MTPLAIMAVAACLSTGGGADRITAGDLLPVWPALASVPVDAPLGLAPLPGARRVFRVAELRRIALRLGLEAAPDRELCVEHKMAALDPTAIAEAMRAALPDIRVEVLDYSRRPVPEGRVEFTAEALRRSGDEALWNGCVRYGSGRRFPIWARVRAYHAALRVVAAAELKAGRPIEAAQIRAETVEAFPEPGLFAASVEEVEGRMLRRHVAPGTPIRMAWLEARKEVLRGEVVHVEAQFGGARLEGEAVAEASGSVGQSVPVLNPVSRKRYMARVVARGRVSVGKGVQ